MNDLKTRAEKIAYLRGYVRGSSHTLGKVIKADIDTESSVTGLDACSTGTPGADAPPPWSQGASPAQGDASVIGSGEGEGDSFYPPQSVHYPADGQTPTWSPGPMPSFTPADEPTAYTPDWMTPDDNSGAETAAYEYQVRERETSYDEVRRQTLRRLRSLFAHPSNSGHTINEILDKEIERLDYAKLRREQEW